MSKGWVSYIRTYGIVVFLPLTLGACRPKVATSSLGEVYLPDHLTSPRERLGYLIDHYWDKMEAQPDTSQALITRHIEDFCGLLHGVPLGTARPWYLPLSQLPLWRSSSNSPLHLPLAAI